MPEKELFPLNRLVFFLDSVGQIAREDHSKKLKIKTNKQFICTLYILYNPTIPAKIQSQYQFLRRARHFPGFCLRMFRSSRRCVSSSGPPRGWGWARPCRSPWWWTGSRSRGHPCWRRRSRWSSQDTPGCRSSPAAIKIYYSSFIVLTLSSVINNSAQTTDLSLDDVPGVGDAIVIILLVILHSLFHVGVDNGINLAQDMPVDRNHKCVDKLTLCLSL